MRPSLRFLRQLPLLLLRARTSILLLLVVLSALPVIPFTPPTGDVVISSNTSWAAGTYSLTSLTVNSGAVLTIGGGSTVTVTAGVTVTANSSIVLAGANTNAKVSGAWAGIGVTMNAESVEVDAGSSIDADGQGYGTSDGPGGGALALSPGGSYGGLGGNGNGGTAPSPIYGSIVAPSDLGSGGGSRCCGALAGSGGGAIRLIVSGTLTNNGTISSNGAATNGSQAGAGAGGSVYITAGTLSGAGGFVANGGAGGEAGGGGGRVAVYYNASNGYTGFTSSTANGGTGNSAGSVGTIGFFDTSATNDNLTVVQSFPVPAGTAAAYNSVTVFAGATLTIGGGAQLTLANTLTVSGTVVVQSLNNTSKVNGTWQGAGATIDAASVLVNPGGSLNADGQGYGISDGPGGGAVAESPGGSYGGTGGFGNGNVPSSAIYGSATAPTDPGSGGGGRCCGAEGGTGGGAIRLIVSGTLTNNGVISANGAPTTGTEAGGGAGGSLYVTAGALAGAGPFTANGGAGGEAGGGGGRVAIYYGSNSNFSGFTTSTATGATGNSAGSNGTVGFFDTSAPNSNLTVYQDFVVSAGATETHNAVTVQPGAQLTVGGGATLTAIGALTVSGSLVVQSINNTSKILGIWQGAGATIVAGSVLVNASGSLNADRQGYVAAAGPAGGASASSAAGSYGGLGGIGQAAGSVGPTYGSATAPTAPGSGGSARCCGASGGAGGGAIELVIAGALTDNGIISANGGATVGNEAGGGAGGSIYIFAGSLNGTGNIAANGGAGGEAGGGGGRIAIYYAAINSFAVSSVSAAGAAGNTVGAAGTVTLSESPQLLWFQPTGYVLHGSAPLEWYSNTGAQMNVTVSGPQSFTLASGAPTLEATTWDTTTVPDGRYELRLVLLDSNGNILNQLPRTIAVNNSVVWHTGTIASNQEWTASQVQAIDGVVIIPPGVTVTIDAGAIVKAAPGAEIIVENGGILNALGGTSNPVIFTTFDDSSVGGNTDFNAGSSIPSPGEWQGVTAQSGAQFNTNSNTQIRYVTAALSGTLSSSQTLVGTSVYTVTGALVVPSGVSLTIPPGTILKFNGNAGITVQPGGSLQAIGTAAQPIYFTSLKDDSLGGDTNGDGSATSPAPGDWATILIDGAQASLVHVQMYYGSGPVSASTPDVIGMIETTGNAVVTISDCVIAQGFWNGIQTGYPDGGGDTVTIANTVLWGLEDRAINAWPGSTVHVVNDTIDGNTTGVMAHGGTVDIENSIVSNTKGATWGGIVLCCSGSFSSLMNNDVWTSVAGVGNYNGIGDPTGMHGNVSANPVFVNEPQGNFILNYGSPAIDAANGTVANYPLTDAAGNGRYNDPQAANKTGVPDSNGNYPDMGAFEFVATEPSNVDMTVSSVTGPSAAVAGTPVTISWTVTNIGAGVVYGPWHDAVYLVRDAAAVFAGQFLEGSGTVLGPGASYTASATVRVPGMPVGNAQWEVKTNVLGEVFEGANANNNTELSLDTVAVDVPALTVNSSATGTFAGTGQSWWYKIAPGANQNVSLALGLTVGLTPGVVQLFVGQGYIPTPQSFDSQQVEWNSPTASLILSNTSSQTYYVTAYAQALTNSPAPFSLSATASTFSLTSVQPGSAVNTGSATLTFVGGGLLAGATYQLVGPGGTLGSTAVYVSDSAHANVTFNMSGVAAGSYAAQVISNGNTVSLPNAVTVAAASNTSVTNGNGQVQVTLSTPAAFRAGFPSPVTLNYQNVGADDIAAPLIELSATGATVVAMPPACTGCDPNFGLKYQNTFNSGVILGIDTDGPPGVLPAGAKGSASFLVTPGSADHVGFSVNTVEVPSPVDAALEAFSGPQTSNMLLGMVAREGGGGGGGGGGNVGNVGYRLENVGEFRAVTDLCKAFLPVNASAAGFSRTCMQFLVNAGYRDYPLSGNSSFSFYVGPTLAASGPDQLLAADANALGKAGVYQSDLGHLMNFEFLKDGFEIFNQRYHQGAFGYGPSQPFDITARLLDPTPTVFYPNGDTRAFNTPDPANSSRYLGQVGDYGTLTINADGSWTLTEQNGQIFHLIPAPAPNPLGTYILDYIQDLRGNRTTLTYTNGLVSTVTAADGDTLTYGYDSMGHIVRATDPLGRVTTYGYDIVLDSMLSTYLTSITTASGTTTLTWNEGGKSGIGYLDDTCVTTYCEAAIGVTSISFPDGTHQYFTYDGLGRLATQYADGQSNLLTFTYNSDGSVTTTDALSRASTTATNERGETTLWTDPLGAVMQVSYDPESKLTGILGPLGTSMAVSYDSRSNPTGLRDPLGNQQSLSYGNAGSLQALIDPNGNALSYAYDDSYNVTGLTYPDGSVAGATYDANGNMLTYTNRRGRTITFTYDSHNLLTSKTYTNGSQVFYTYDGHRNLLSVTAASGVTTFAYDSADRLTSDTNPGGQSIQYAYNAGGQRVSMTDSTGFAVYYSYDSAGRLLQLSGANNALIAGYVYDNTGRLSRKTLGNGTYSTYTYALTGNLLHVIHYSPAGAVLSEFDYTYDALGRRTGMNAPAGAWTYQYDAAGQIVSVTMPGGSVQYQYDADGNRTASTNGTGASYLTNNLDEYTQAGSAAYSYDADGNLISGAGWTYSYDDENRLVGMASATDTWSYQYDGLGNRVSATHNGTVTRYLNDVSGFGNVEAEFNASGQLIGHYTYGLDLTSSIPAAGTAAYYHFDGAGNTAQMTNSAGTVVNSYAYLPFGEKVTNNAGVVNPFTFAGEVGVMDEGSGLYFMRERWYNPALGRFVQTDPSGLSGGDFNLYRYVGNSPSNFADPTGLVTDYVSGQIAFGISLSYSVNAHTGDSYLSPGLCVCAGASASAGRILNLPPGTDRGATTNSFLGGFSFAGGHVAAGGLGGGLAASPGTGIAVEASVGAEGNAGGFSYGINTTTIGVAIWDTINYKCGYCLFNYPPQDVLVPVAHSSDPNGKLTGGVGTQGYIPPNLGIPYTIYFENQSTATAPAQKVVVTDQLSSSLDWSALQLNQVEFNNVSVSVPAGLQNYSTQVNVSTDPNPVNVTVAFNNGTGLLTWTMQSVDPVTGGSPANPLAGFLPPNNSGNQGTGFVTFSVNPKPGLANGATIANQGSIVFDQNGAIATNTVTNTIDSTVPVSVVNALPATSASVAFPVSWSGSDPGGSGIAAYNIFAAVDGGSYATWLTNSTATSATYTGLAGHQYSFYSLAVNSVGTLQTTPGPAQSTTISASAAPGVCDIDNDGVVTITDIQAVINQALGAALSGNDLNQDGVVNVIDVQIVMNATLNLGCTQ
ncbi:MAG TPA: RHS repeat-associated core domain-containing protein [Bryobacteraceae bacterium]|jgi:RHS repeat-associated protein|nr:RHS repeat-associated core domain-containing protein [Bryobacteraceae bacterium]